eukprot:TRINITY_DN5135_c0_g1_i1.p1 TRINITY_DN5135_c0_g1~~TRINITY_DN5135_c0_g1_i1.p1  ORF type:complete len:219 (-),score=94.02 TRINITY_DN5135_c0_g1_i1:13-612(-)
MQNLKFFLTLLIFLQCFLLFNQTQIESCPDLVTVPTLDIEAYMGQWYQILDIPQIYEISCRGCTTAYYVFNETSSTILVDNQCQKYNYLQYEVCGYAVQIDSKNYPGKLQVYFPDFSNTPGDYYIMKLGPYNAQHQYSYSLIGSPCRDTLYILSRTSSLDNSIIQSLLQFAQQQGFDVSKIKTTVQFDCYYGAPTCGSN